MKMTRFASRFTTGHAIVVTEPTGALHAFLAQELKRSSPSSR
ncbi:hypothetical protein PC116_g1088 [Phytophthora cactorum]|uniref:Uncharacterized protein n=1 Tax=Phytophthora cactorum TaxID=29920 RepID=A0A8T1DK52_9STRA|nr:hypothetical protein Pcac1_g21274 [Phytophthora cactorum]KAG3113105.1 hypothetical protein PI125_g7635 [Phytophthora idaei]KAG2907450.1 hypothetical protein PC114_g10798 [Phytophthora cactorum]KAG2941854.1 hypothetical protein PC117_g10069 [Phytophthora cactorum]KAG3021097.1 hypothetical protein PC120_g8890 [Phytophthora cactorum]